MYAVQVEQEADGVLADRLEHDESTTAKNSAPMLPRLSKHTGLAPEDL